MLRNRLAARLTWTALTLLTTVACGDDILDPGPPGAAGSATQISAMTRNVYIGTDVDRVLAAVATPDPTDDTPAIVEATATLQKTAFPERAQALAGEIAEHRPHFIGLQEVTQLNIQLPPQGINVRLDFLPILEAALAQR